MKTKLYMNIIPLSFLIFSSILINSCSTMDKNKSEIGAILPLTGSSSYLGQSVLDGMKIAFEDFNKLNKTDYVFDPYDYQGKISSVNNIYQLTKTKDNPNLVLSWMSSVASALVQNTEKDNTLLFVGAAKPELTENTKFVIRLWPNAIDLANIESDFAINKLKCKNVGIFYINDDYGLA
ncbi:MAG: ABC transporter substrate-binding protein, partial [Actinobacteria bacterium]|nr:ABC transporter substrate-binding protein [Actinomycetota bacterium]